MIEYLISAILILLFMYLLVGGCLWFKARYRIVFRVIKKTPMNEWSRMPGGGCGPVGDLDVDDFLGTDDYLSSAEETRSASHFGMAQLPGIFSRRLQKR